MTLKVYICPDCEAVFDEDEYINGKCPDCGKTNVMLESEYYDSVTPISQPQPQNVPKCPTCGSTNVEKISTAKKALGFAMVGLFSSNLGKTMHCKNCGYKW